jgi:hypothetical protein
VEDLEEADGPSSAVVDGVEDEDSGGEKQTQPTREQAQRWRLLLSGFCRRAWTWRGSIPQQWIATS